MAGVPTRVEEEVLPAAALAVVIVLSVISAVVWD